MLCVGSLLGSYVVRTVLRSGPAMPPIGSTACPAAGTTPGDCRSRTCRRSNNTSPGRSSPGAKAVSGTCSCSAWRASHSARSSCPATMA